MLCCWTFYSFDDRASSVRKWNLADYACKSTSACWHDADLESFFRILGCDIYPAFRGAQDMAIFDESDKATFMYVPSLW
jgi:hypothetical protein